MPVAPSEIGLPTGVSFKDNPSIIKPIPSELVVPIATYLVKKLYPDGPNALQQNLVDTAEMLLGKRLQAQLPESVVENALLLGADEKAQLDLGLRFRKGETETTPNLGTIYAVSVIAEKLGIDLKKKPNQPDLDRIREFYQAIHPYINLEAIQTTIRTLFPDQDLRQFIKRVKYDALIRAVVTGIFALDQSAVQKILGDPLIAAEYNVARLTALASEHKRLMKENQGLKAQLEAKAQEMKTLEVELTALREKVGIAEAETASLRTKAELAEVEIAQLQAELAEKGTKLAEVAKTLMTPVAGTTEVSEENLFGPEAVEEAPSAPKAQAPATPPKPDSIRRKRGGI